ncbi:FAD:protein FMN transferase [Pedobacter heparinus]|uniref:FAD:protein FMN transferase n=1 Tax=Pedobacter heparinus (strain ATCC 13125 / DSM 2366 / CIP 104194 / JCM 7457 / NBRC 12017 / NCIMB 9290 / NRRL B-14731 / HIM 762-3) TaxID=485917 RepID=C6Y3S4_PEDHD|nr:FAD:protein FMN transferase [Pedobacter heparinus]ACU03353.1 ApbE family lipoprotein [Pedobacter heparinus DSM 2366]
MNFFSGYADLREYTIKGYAQGTDYTVKYFAADSIVTKADIDRILNAIDSSMSLYKPYSLICRFNAADEGLHLDQHLVKVMRKSFAVYKDTRGKFDATVEPLVQAWGFGAKPIIKFPDSAEVKMLLACVGMNNLSLKGDYLKKSRPCIKLDLNGIAQGYSVDVIADYLQQKKIKSFVVELGGELRMKGPKPDGSSLRIGIEGPAMTADAEPVIKHVVRINNGAITTAGNYRKYLLNGAKKIAHLIDPKTGYPLDNALISVTIYAKDAITADGYDSPIMAMGVKEALDFVKARKGMEAYIIYHKKDGSVADTLTSGFRKMLVD